MPTYTCYAVIITQSPDKLQFDQDFNFFEASSVLIELKHSINLIKRLNALGLLCLWQCFWMGWIHPGHPFDVTCKSFLAYDHYHSNLPSYNTTWPLSPFALFLHHLSKKCEISQGLYQKLLGWFGLIFGSTVFSEIILMMIWCSHSLVVLALSHWFIVLPIVTNASLISYRT